MIDYAVQVLGSKVKESDILEVIEPANICNGENYMSFDVDMKGQDPSMIRESCMAII